jgi:hypothetical protein
MERDEHRSTGSDQCDPRSRTPAGALAGVRGVGRRPICSPDPRQEREAGDAQRSR